MATTEKLLGWIEAAFSGRFRVVERTHFKPSPGDAYGDTGESLLVQIDTAAHRCFIFARCVVGPGGGHIRVHAAPHVCDYGRHAAYESPAFPLTREGWFSLVAFILAQELRPLPAPRRSKPGPWSWVHALNDTKNLTRPPDDHCWFEALKPATIGSDFSTRDVAHVLRAETPPPCRVVQEQRWKPSWLLREINGALVKNWDQHKLPPATAALVPAAPPQPPPKHAPLPARALSGPRDTSAGAFRDGFFGPTAAYTD